MENIIKILMERDNISQGEAEEAVEDCVNYIHFCLENGDYDEAYYAIEDCLGLEPDYLDYLM